MFHNQQIRKYSTPLKVNSLSGFSLLETILIALILVVIAGLTIPNFSGTYERLQLKNTVDHMAYLMRYAQSRAITKNVEMRFSLDESASRYWIEETVSNEYDEQAFSKVKGRLGKEFTWPSSVVVEGDATTVHFFSDGQIEKFRMPICNEKICYLISTAEQRGVIYVYEEET